jgi:hypothetical protein
MNCRPLPFSANTEQACMAVAIWREIERVSSSGIT